MTTLTRPRAVARVNHGRWIADCPFCPGAEQIWPQGIRRAEDVAFPFGIANGILHCGTTGSTCPVDFPDERFDITRVLARRPDERTRNWFPGESVADLVAENIGHGVR